MASLAKHFDASHPLYLMLDGAVHIDGNGFGCAYRADGSVVYRGGIKDGTYHGIGQTYCASGHLKFAGHWEQGVRHGQGTLYHANGAIEFDGVWNRGQVAGPGTFYDAAGRLQFRGEFLDGMRHGSGTTYYSTGQPEYSGNWERGMRQGRGVHYRNDGSLQYDGEWAGDAPAGRGTLVDPTGEPEFEGEFHPAAKTLKERDADPVLAALAVSSFLVDRRAALDDPDTVVAEAAEPLHEIWKVLFGRRPGPQEVLSMVLGAKKMMQVGVGTWKARDDGGLTPVMVALFQHFGLPYDLAEGTWRM